MARDSRASPAPLHAQAFGEIAAEHVLPEMHELAVEIDPDLAAMSRQRRQKAKSSERYLPESGSTMQSKKRQCRCACG